MGWPTMQYEPPPLYFMHVRKTAGTAWHTLLKGAYAPQALVHITVHNHHHYSLANFGQFRAFRSHFGPGLLPCIEQPGMVCITMLRDPIEQFVSQLYFKQAQLKRHPERFEAAYAEKVRPLLHADLQTLVASSRLLIRDNPQSCNLGFVKDFLPYFKNGLRMRAIFSEQAHYAATDMPAIASCAHAQLDRMAVVGITEHFAESTALLCDLLGIPQPQVLPEKNMGVQKQSVVQRYRPQLSPDLLEQISAKTQYDQALYTHACERFAEQCAHYDARPHRTYNIASRQRSTASAITNVAPVRLKQLAKTLGQRLQTWRRSSSS